MMFSRRALAFGFGVTLALGLSLALPLGGLASGTQVVELRDDCEPASFNAVLGPGACVGSGTTTFSEFIAELQEDQVASDWVFDPDQVTIHVGDKLTIQNTGGEAHTFTKVTSFGGGLVAPLNALSGNLVPAVPAPGVNVFATFVPAGGVTTVSSAAGGILTPGQNLFECFIHPWMRAVVTVETD
jgi:plastocyanin